jgi:hypothetical protein
MTLPTIVKWLDVFIVRFFETSQFKRSAMPNAPKVGSGGSLSPPGDWRAPSDASAAAWLKELHSTIAANPDASESTRPAPVARAVRDKGSQQADRVTDPLAEPSTGPLRPTPP